MCFTYIPQYRIVSYRDLLRQRDSCLLEQGPWLYKKRPSPRWEMAFTNMDITI